MPKLNDNSDVLVPVKMLRRLPGLLFNAMFFAEEYAQQEGRSDAAQIRRLVEEFATARNEIGKLLGYTVFPPED